MSIEVEAPHPGLLYTKLDSRQLGAEGLNCRLDAAREPSRVRIAGRTERWQSLRRPFAARRIFPRIVSNCLEAAAGSAGEEISDATRGPALQHLSGDCHE
jgi:hypothetical protein